MTTDFFRERVIVMPPVSMKLLELIGEDFLEQVAPEALTSAGPLDVVDLAENRLPEFGIHVSRASMSELGDCAGVTDPDGEGDTDILIREDIYEQLLDGGRRANLARCTVVHEVVHAFLHVPEVRLRRKSPTAEVLLARKQRGDIPAYCDPEWQAFAMAGSILMPRRTLSQVAKLGVDRIAEIYQVSDSFVRSHLKRLKMEVVGC